MKIYILHENEHLHEERWPREIAARGIRKYERKSGENKNFTSHSGGNLIDGLHPAFNYKDICVPSHDNRKPKHDGGKT